MKRSWSKASLGMGNAAREALGGGAGRAARMGAELEHFRDDGAHHAKA